MLTHLPGGSHDEAATFQTKTPWTGPWHIIVIGANHEVLAQSEVFRELEN
jgi:hypothetical protein